MNNDLKKAQEIIRELLLIVDFALCKNSFGIKHNDVVDSVIKAEKFLAKIKD